MSNEDTEVKEVKVRCTRAIHPKESVPIRFGRKERDSIINNLEQADHDHQFLTANGLCGLSCAMHGGSEEADEDDLQGAITAVISDINREPLCVLVIRDNPDGAFENMIIPTVRIHGGFIRIGKLTDRLLVVDDYATGLALNHATGDGVVVVLHHSNFGPVCRALRKKYRGHKLIICLDRRIPDAAGPTHTKILNAARDVEAQVAYPTWDETFLEMYRIHGPFETRCCIDNAQDAPVLTANIDEETIDHPVDPPVWNGPVNGEWVFRMAVELFQRHVSLTESQAVATVLWVISTYLCSVLDFAPLLIVTSPVLECGKTTYIKLSAKLCYRPVVSSSMTTAVLFRLIDKISPTLILDEAETFMDSAEGMRGIINAGHSRGAADTYRIEGGKVRKYNVFGPKIISGIGPRSATIMSRGIVMEMMRARQDEPIAGIGPSEALEIEVLQACLARWAQDNMQNVANATFDEPPLGNSRTNDNWRALFAIAHCLGEKIFNRAVNAAVELSANQERGRCTAEELFRDIKLVFESIHDDKITTVRLIAALCEDLEKPWATFDRGRPITMRQLADLLRPFKIKSIDLRIGSQNLKGYRREHFSDAFARYTPDVPK